MHTIAYSILEEVKMCIRIFYCYDNTKNAVHTCRGTVISVATKAKAPRKALFNATAVDDLPLFESTTYAKVLE
jgi:hypothetical protein